MLSIAKLFFEGKEEAALLHRIKSNVKAEKLKTSPIGAAIAIAKSQGFIIQDGKNLKLTNKGKEAAGKAIKTLESEGYSYDPSIDRWTK